MDLLNSSQGLLPLVISVFINLIIPILICRTLVQTLNLIEPQNRSIKAWLIWLNIFFEPIVSFLIAKGMSNSIVKELEYRNFEEEKSPTLSQGLTYAILSLIVLVTAVLIFNKVITEAYLPLISVVYFSKVFFMIQYWIKILWYKKILENDGQEQTGKERLEEGDQ